MVIKSLQEAVKHADIFLPARSIPTVEKKTHNDQNSLSSTASSCSLYSHAVCRGKKQKVTAGWHHRTHLDYPVHPMHKPTTTRTEACLERGRDAREAVFPCT